MEINRKYIYNISMGKRTYEQVLYEINNARRFGNAPGVEIIGKILQILRKTENNLGRIPFVHIAGTNGKGSVCAFFRHNISKGRLLHREVYLATSERI